MYIYLHTCIYIYTYKHIQYIDIISYVRIYFKIYADNVVPTCTMLTRFSHAGWAKFGIIEFTSCRWPGAKDISRGQGFLSKLLVDLPAEASSGGFLGDSHR